MAAVTVEELAAVYNRFGIDVHSVPSSLQMQVNSMAREIVRLKKKLKGKKAR